MNTRGMRKLSYLFLIVLLGCQTSTHYTLSESPTEHDERMEWWRDARFGMFIHWGLYSVPAGEWGDSKNHAEWIRTTAQIPLEKYDQFVPEFNPQNYNPQAWVKMAKDAGMKYIVITSKHHDGFCLWDSKMTDFDIASTPYEKDLLAPLAKACRKEGIKLCFYHSIMDWHHPDYLPRRGWEKDRSTEGADFDRYVDYMKKQLKELLTDYGEIGVLWFDGEWENTWTNEYGQDLYQYVRSLQPDILVNNRVSVGRSGMEGLTKEGEFGGDFGTPEQQIPSTGVPGVDWETCMTMNGHWGYNRFDKDFKSTTGLLQKLADISSKGGNFLLNIGPKADGTFPQESIDRLREMGYWMDTYSESIYETSASPFKSLDWGRCTQKPMAESTRLYLHVFDWPTDGKLELPGLANNPIRAYLLADEDEEELNFQKIEGSLVIKLPDSPTDSHNSVVVVDIEGKPEVFEAPLLISEFSSFVNQVQVRFEKPEAGLQLRYTLDGIVPTATSDLYQDIIVLSENATVKVAKFNDNVMLSGVTTCKFIKQKEIQGQELESPLRGLTYQHFIGKWSKVPDFSVLNSSEKGIALDFQKANIADNDEFGIRYKGYIKISKAEAFKFYLTADDGAKLWIGDRLLIDNDGLHAAQEKSGIIALGSGYHPIRIDYFENSGGNALKLEWANQDIQKQKVDPELFFHLN